MRNQLDVLLISMPFGPLNLPSLGLSLLKAGLKDKGITSKVEYHTLTFAETIGAELYMNISAGFPNHQDLLGEWLFSTYLFNHNAEKINNYNQEILFGRHPDHNKDNTNHSIPKKEFIDQLDKVLNIIPTFIQKCLDRFLSNPTPIVGFTSVFQQNLASLCLAKRIKEARPDTLIVFGGANCEGAMGKKLIEKFDFIDVIISGEADVLFPDFVKTYLDKGVYLQNPNIYTTNQVDSTDPVSSEPVSSEPVNLNNILAPDFEDFFDQWKQTTFSKKLSPIMLFETSRGCWWGEISHCTFCGLNGVSMAFRSKTAEKAINELKFLIKKYEISEVSVVDNILDMAYFKDFVPLLEKENLNISLFYEVKSNLKKPHLQALFNAGIRYIQPGIESLSDEILKLMGKGVSMLQNIQLLKWCKEIGINPQWNMIWGFPRESETAYSEMDKMIPIISHLPPPSASANIRLDRFSPNFSQSKQRGFSNVRPYKSYSFIYPFPPEDLFEIAYHFAFDYTQPQFPEEYTRPLEDRLSAWRKGYEKSDLIYLDRENHLLLWDLREKNENGFTILRGLNREIMLKLDRIQTIKQIMNSTHVSEEEVQSSLSFLSKENLIIRNKNHYLSLALNMKEYSMSNQTVQRLAEQISQKGIKNKEGNIEIDLALFS